MSNSKYKLPKEIIEKSFSKTWDEAKTEWEIYEVYEDLEFDTCLCGHYPIKQICILNNSTTHYRVKVGNCCVKKFLGLPSHLIFNAIKRIKIDNNKSLNAVTIDYAHTKEWINDWEYEFLFSTIRKRKLTPNQLGSRIKINKRILHNVNCWLS